MRFSQQACPIAGYLQQTICNIDPRSLDKMTRSWSKTGLIGRIKAPCFAEYDHDIGHSYWRRVFLLLLFGRHPLKEMDAGGHSALVLVAARVVCAGG